MVAASAFLTTVVADSIVGGYRGAPNTVGVVWPAVLRNAAAVAILTVAAGGGDGQISVQSVIVFLHRGHKHASSPPCPQRHR